MWALGGKLLWTWFHQPLLTSVHWAQVDRCQILGTKQNKTKTLPSGIRNLLDREQMGDPLHCPFPHSSQAWSDFLLKSNKSCSCSVCWVDSNLKLLISKPPGWDEVPCSGSLSGNHDSISATGMHFMGYVWIAFQSGDGGKADYPELSHSILFGQILLQDRLSRLCVLLWNP